MAPPLDATPPPRSTDPLRAIRFDALSVEQGLSHSSVWSMVQDDHGFLWIGTQNGLNRYDGYRFEVHRHDPEDPGSISGSDVLQVFLDQQGELWLGTRASGLNRFDRDHQVFIRYPTDPEGPSGPSHASIQGIAETVDGSLWISTPLGLDRFDGERFESAFTWSSRVEGSGNPSGLAATADGGLWVSIGRGLVRWTPDRPSFEDVPYPRLAPDGQVPTLIALLPRDDGQLWIGTDDGVDLFDPVAGEVVAHHTHDPRDPGSLSGSIVHALHLDRRGDLWVGTQGAGLNRLEPTTGLIERFLAEPADPWSLDDGTINSILEDRSGILWFSTYQGLAKLDPHRRRFAVYRRQPGVEQTLNGSGVWAIHRDGNDILWVGTYSQGLERVDRLGGTVEHFPATDVVGAGPPGATVSALVADGEHHLWVGSWGGLARFDQRDRSFETFRPDPNDPTSLGHDGVNTLWLAPDRRLWIGTLGGLFHLDLDLGLDTGEPRRFVAYPTHGGQPAALGTSAFYAIAQDPTGRLWLPSASNEGLLWLDPKTGDSGVYRHRPGDRSSLASDMLTVALVDRRGWVWVGTANAGVDRFDPTTGEFLHLTRRNGLAGDSANSLLEDADGHLWVAGNEGLSRIDPETLAITVFDVDDGMAGNVFTTGSSFLGADGEVFFGSPEGLTAFFPGDLALESEPPTVVVHEFLVGGAPPALAAVDPTSPLERSILHTDRLELHHRHRVISFGFSTLDFSRPWRNHYRYRLEGFEDDWVETDASRRFARYTNLDPGEYTFRVRGSRGDGRWGDEGRAIQILVHPPPWLTWWAMVGYAVLGLTLTGLFVRSQRLQVAQEQAVSRRLREVDRLKDQFLANTSHELRTPLFGMIGIAESLASGASGDVGDAVRRQLQTLITSGRRLSGLVDEILDFSRLSGHTVILDRASLALRPAVTEVVDLSRPLVGDKALRLINSVPADLPNAYADGNRLAQILHNLVGNAVKFTHTGEVEITAEAEDEHLVVRVRDTGVGIPADKLEGIFHPFEQADASTEREFGGTGLGLAVTEHLVRLHSGTIRVDSEVGQGTSFVFTLPRADARVQETLEDWQAPALAAEAEGSPSPALEPTLPHPSAPAAAAPLALNPEPFTETAMPEDTADLAAVLTPPASADGDWRLLVVDDEPVNRQVLTSYLSFAGYAVEVCVGGQEALELLADKPFDLVLLDVMMPKMSGYEVCTRIRRHWSREELPVLFLTAKTQVSDRVRGLAHGGNDYLTKPVARDELLARLTTHLGLLEAHRTRRRLLVERADQLRRLDRQSLELSAKNRELEQFTYTVSHDLKSPLITVGGFLGLVEKDLESGRIDRLPPSLGRIRRALQTMEQLLEGLLELSRIGHVTRSLDPIPLADLVDECLELVAGEIAERGVDVMVDRLPGTIRGDRLRLRQVIQNLLSNAVKFMGSQERPEIHIDQELEGDGIVLRITDNGIGISNDDRERIFDLFQQVDHELDGTGIGLALVRRIMEVHGGRVWVESDGPGQGSTFCLEFPGT